MPRPHFTMLTAGREGASAGESGFTLLELLVVLGIIVMLATVAGPQVLRYMSKARTDTAKAQLSSLTTAVELYALDNGGYPAQQVGLGALMQPPPGASHWRGPYLKRADGLIDPWGRPYQYRYPGQQAQVEIFTLGRDNALGGSGEDQDVRSW